MKRHKTVEDYFKAIDQWKEELLILRSVLLDTELTETVKWGIPTYTFKGKNVVGISGFKSYFGLWFFQGALLRDDKNVLINAQEGKTKALRQWRIESAQEINPELIKAYVMEAINIQQSGKSIKPAKKKPLIIPDELNQVFAKDAELKEKFEAFTHGKKREFTEYISEAKREATKLSRLNKCIPLIKAGTGLNDKYR